MLMMTLNESSLLINSLKYLIIWKTMRKKEFQDEDLLGDTDEIDEMTLRLENSTREVEKAKLRQKIMMNAVDQQKINLPSRVKID